MDCDESKYWEPSIKDELNSLIKRGTWTLMRRPPGVYLTKTKWTFRKKHLSENRARYKSRLVVKGFTQRYGFEFTDTYAPTLSASALRVLLAFFAKKRFKAHSIDIKTAFLYGDLQHDVYLAVPEGYQPQNENENKLMREGPVCLKLNKAQYGTRQGSYAW